ncbi:signal peptidase I [Roseburia sp. 499]|uniref:signal peptidase I n=1 Tax=Roseburia sp. 499 TaxID=1261634 RepID=UPI00095169B0|nr:signal peptidase I [Roseburia sp. 499]WVK70898.1 signal peptidase I [Roseburia sp. 499]
MRRRSSGLNFNRRKRKINTGLLKEIGIWAGEILLVMVVAVMLVSFVGFRITVVGASMSPTLESGQEILVNRFVYKIFSPKQNDLIVFLPNGNEKSHYYVKRVIAGPGDKVQIKDGVVYVNGEKFTEEAAVSNIENALLAENEITVGEDEYFVLGDNRNNSEDSRYASIGNVKKDHIVGKAWFVVSPWGKFGFIK